MKKQMLAKTKIARETVRKTGSKNEVSQKQPEKRIVLVLGGLGYIGRVVCEELKKENFEPVVIDNNLFNLESSNKAYINCDVLNKEKLDNIFKNYSGKARAVINLAAIVGDPACLVNTRKALNINCVGTRNSVELANKYGFKMIHASTCSLYGAEICSKDCLLNEESHVFPIDFYGQTKYQQERFVRELAKDYCVFRLGTAYGVSPRMRYDLVLNLFCAKAANHETLFVYGGTQYRPFIHIRDVARAFIYAIKKNLRGLYNLAGENVSIRELAELLESKYDAKVEVNNLIEDPRNYTSDNKKLLSTGFRFEWNIEKGVKEMIDFSKGINYNDIVYNNHKLMESLETDETKILITGGSGKLGRACKKIMPKAQYPARQELDLQKPETIEQYFSTHDIKVVIHLAAMIGIPPCENDRKKAYDINVNGTKRLLDASKKHGVKHFIYLSTACVFPGTDNEVMEDEDSLPYPKHYYGLTKFIAEEISKVYDSPEMKVTVARTNFASMPWEYPKAFTDRYGTYLFAQGVAKGLKDIVIFKPKNQVIHICGDRKISMYDYAKAGGSNVTKMTLEEYKGPPLTKNMCLTSKYWRLYRLEDSDFNDS